MIRNSVLCQWLMTGHRSDATSCWLHVLLVYSKWMGTGNGQLLGLGSCTLPCHPPPPPQGITVILVLLPRGVSEGGWGLAGTVAR